MALPILNLQAVDVSLEGKKILRDINWTLRPGEQWCVVGPNGSGKSTLLRLLRGDLWPDPGTGSRTFQVQGELQESPLGWREQVPLLSPETQQRYLRQDWILPVQSVIASGFTHQDYLYHPLTRHQKSQILKVMDLLDLHRFKQRDIQTLSTGEFRKVLLARALVSEPPLLILDEFADGLDLPSRRILFQHLAEICAQGGQIIYSTHRPSEFLPFTTHVLKLSRGRISATHPYQPPEHHRLPLPKKGPPLKASSAGAALDKANTSKKSKKPLLRLENVQLFQGGRCVVGPLTWTLAPGEHWAVTGRNGAGKSTLLKLLASELYPALGGVVERFGGRAFRDVWELKRWIGMVSPDLHIRYEAELSGWDVIASGFFATVGLHTHLTVTQKRRVQEVMKAFNAKSFAKADYRTLSYGQVRKLLCLRALVHHPKLLILDEPFDGLDTKERAEMQRFLTQIAGSGTQIVLTTHHEEDLPGFITHRLEL